MKRTGFSNDFEWDSSIKTSQGSLQYTGRLKGANDIVLTVILVNESDIAQIKLENSYSKDYERKKRLGSNVPGPSEKAQEQIEKVIAKAYGQAVTNYTLKEKEEYAKATGEFDKTGVFDHSRIMENLVRHCLIDKQRNISFYCYFHKDGREIETHSGALAQHRTQDPQQGSTIHQSRPQAQSNLPVIREVWRDLGTNSTKFKYENQRLRLEQVVVLMVGRDQGIYYVQGPMVRIYLDTKLPDVEQNQTITAEAVYKQFVPLLSDTDGSHVFIDGKIISVGR